MKKTVIALRGVGSSGKTSSLIKLRVKLMKIYNAQEFDFNPINNKEKDLYQSTLKIPAQKISVINTPVNLEKFTAMYAQEKVQNEKEKLGWSKNEKVIIWVGRPVKVKRLPLLLKVFKSNLCLHPFSSLKEAGL